MAWAALLHCANPRRTEAATSARDQTANASSSNATAMRRLTRLLDRQLVVPASNVLHEGVSGDHDPGAAVLLEPAHRTQPRLEAAVVALDSVVGVPIGSMPGRRQQLLEHCRVHRRVVGDHLDWRDPHRADGALEEPAGGLRVPACRDEHVDDLAELINRAVRVAPLPSDLHIGLVDLPAVTDGVAAGPGGLGQQRRQSHHPAIHRDVVDLDPAFGDQLLNVAVGQAEAQVPAHCEHDHIGRDRNPANADRASGAGRGGGFSCRQPRRSRLVIANATVPKDPLTFISR
jgi:hypothetical protein